MWQRNLIRTMLVALCWLPTACVLFMPVDSLKERELRFAYPRGQLQDNGPKPMGAMPPPDCREFYDVGRSMEWADCMGVGIK